MGRTILPSFFLDLLFKFQDTLTYLFQAAHAPEWLHGILVLGAYRVLAWVVAVMLPPMAIFFPLFTLLEDAGIFPALPIIWINPSSYAVPAENRL